MPQVVFPLDSTKKFTEQQIVGHNRWHWAIPAQVHVKPGDTFRVHCREWFDGAIHNDDSAQDILNAPLASVHVLSGPIAVQGAKPGDLLIVDILDVGPIPQEDSGPLAGQGWSYTGVFATNNGGGFLTEQFPDAYKVIWDFQGGVATSRHVPGVSYAGIVHPGLMGTAPSAELLAKWNAREQAWIGWERKRGKIEEFNRLLRGARNTSFSTQLGQLALANFPDPQGLKQLGNTTWAETFTSGTHISGTAGSAGFGSIQSGALEASNVDLTTQLVNMITAQRAFQANAQVITTSNQLSQTVINIAH